MATVTIGSDTYTTYKSVAEADTYFNASTRFGDWNALTADEKARSLVSGTRLIDRQVWQGVKEVEVQELAFPRTGVIGCSGDAVTAATTLANAGEASLFLAIDLATGEELDTQSSTEDLVQTLKAGSVLITNFRADSGSSTRFPLPVMDLIGCYLDGGATVIAGSLASGTDGVAFDPDFGVNEGII